METEVALYEGDPGKNYAWGQIRILYKTRFTLFAFLTFSHSFCMFVTLLIYD